MARMNRLSAGNVRTLFFCSFFLEKGITFLLQLRREQCTTPETVKTNDDKRGGGENDGSHSTGWKNGSMLRHNHLVNGPVAPTGLTPPQLHAARRAIGFPIHPDLTTVLLLS